MLINLANPIFETVIFVVVLLFFVIISIRKRDGSSLFPISVTNEIKGVAILAVLLMHVGYFLVQDTRFLFPLSVFGGVGVDIFLFLSGYGLAISSAKKDLSVWQFYLRRLSKIVVPIWLSLAIFALADKFFLHINYGWVTLVENFLGFFPTNDIYRDINSPMWFITLLLFFYLIFPLIFSKKRPMSSALIIFLIALIVTRFTLPVGAGVFGFYKLHLAAFPLGVAFFGLLGREDALRLAPLKTLRFFSHLSSPLRPLFQRMTVNKLTTSIIKYIKNSQLSVHAGFIFILAMVVIFTGIYSGVGKGIVIEEVVSLITAVSLIVLFLIKKSEFGFLALLGQYSFEIYLLHWPLMYRYDFLYKFLPPAVATMAYIIVLIILGYVMKIICDSVTKFIISKFHHRSA